MTLIKNLNWHELLSDMGIIIEGEEMESGAESFYTKTQETLGENFWDKKVMASFGEIVDLWGTTITTASGEKSVSYETAHKIVSLVKLLGDNMLNYWDLELSFFPLYEKVHAIESKKQEVEEGLTELKDIKLSKWNPTLIEGPMAQDAEARLEWMLSWI
jgi:hypothetical protein